MQVQDYGPVGRVDFGGGAAGSVMHPIVTVAIVAACILIFLLPRRRVIVPFLVLVILAPFGEELNVGGLHFFVLRILVLAVLMRMFFGKLTGGIQMVPGGMNTIDKLFSLSVIFRAIAVCLLNQSGAAVIAQGAFLVDALGSYFVLRYLIRDREDIIPAIKVLAALMVVLGICMLNEHLRSQNVFGYLGGVPIVPADREGAVRAQGPFGHSILAGTFAATLVPLFILLWKNGKSSTLAILGILGSTMAVFSSSSSTPLLAYLAAVVGTCMWPMRKRMRMIRWALVGMLAGLQLVMKAPVWFAIDHVDLIAGNSGYHRAILIDQFVRHFFDWWLIGTNLTKTWGWDLWDLANEFVVQGEIGGLTTFVCFVGMICVAFSYIGRARKRVEGDRPNEWLIWLLGVTLFSHIIAFFGISYWDQNRITWYALFVMISVVCIPLLELGAEKPSSAKQSALRDSTLVYEAAPALASSRKRLAH